MYWITRRFGNGRPEEYPVYTVAEAEAEGLDPVDWPRVDIGGWGVTDDGYVLQCHDIYEMSRRDNELTLQFKMTSGRPIAVLTEDMETVCQSQEYRFLDYLETGGHQYSRPQTWQEAEARKTRTVRACRLWASMFVMRQGTLHEEDWSKIGRIYRSDDTITNPGATARRLFNQPKIQRKAMNELAKTVLAAGEGPEDVIEKYNELFEKSLEGDVEDREIALHVADRLRDMLAMNPERPRPEEAQGSSAAGLLQVVEEKEAEVQISDGSTPQLPQP
jgi:hypothetical protein